MRRRFGRPILSLVAVMGCVVSPDAPTAFAHGAIPAGQTPFLVDGELRGGWTSYGFIKSDGDVTRWNAKENAPPFLLWTHMTPRGLLAAAFGGLVRSDDEGCRWSPVLGPLRGRTAGVLAADPIDPMHLWVATSDSTLPNGVYESIDGGLNWAPTGLHNKDVRFHGMQVASEGTLRVMSRPMGSTATTVWVSQDEGATWQAKALSGLGSELGNSRLVGSSADGRRGFVATAVGQDTLELWAIDESAQAVIVSTFAGSFIDAAVEFRGRLWVLVDQATLYRQSSADSPTFEVAADDVPCLLSDAASNRLWRCGEVSEGAHFFSTRDGEQWTPHLGFASVCPSTCGSGASTPNNLFWPAIEAYGVGSDGCDSSSNSDTYGDHADGTTDVGPNSRPQQGCYAGERTWPWTAAIVLLEWLWVRHRGACSVGAGRRRHI